MCEEAFPIAMCDAEDFASQIERYVDAGTALVEGGR
jgi:hypothetical protein